MIFKTIIRLAGCLLMWGTVTQAQLEQIGSIQHTPIEDALLSIPVRIEAQVTHMHPQRSGMYLFDGERGIYVHLEQPAETYEGLQPGSIVRVEGVTAAGGFVTDVVASELTVTDWRPLPEARKFHFFQNFLPNIELDCEWLAVWGRLVDVKELDDFDYLIMELEVNGLRLSVQLPKSDEALSRIPDIMFQRVYIPAVATTIYNSHRQMTGRSYLVNSIHDFVIIREVDEPAELSLRSIEQFMRAGISHMKEVRTRGVVTYADENSVYLRGEVSCLKSSIQRETAVVPGDYVELQGFIWLKPISPAFRARSVTVLEKHEAPIPKAVDLGGELDPDWCYELVETEAVLVDIGETFGMSRFSAQGAGVPVESRHASLLCRSGDRIFEARLPGADLDYDFEPGAKLKLTGICNLVPNVDPRWSHFTEGVWLELRLEDGVEVLVSAPWWTAQRMLWLTVIILGVAGLFIVWSILLRITVGRQTKVISKQVEAASVLNERQRIARELHDTLEQSLTGTTFQLENCAKQIDTNFEKGKELLKLSLGMLRHCRKESRSSIVELRSGSLGEIDLPAMLNKALLPLAEVEDIDMDIQVLGQPRRLTLRVERHLFRLAKEAVTNAIRHASPSQVRVELVYKSNALSMSVVDDGAGFDVDQLTKFERFGLQGMQERVNRIHGVLTITSVIGGGTTILVDLPSTDEWETE